MKKVIIPLVFVMTVLLFAAYGWAGDAGHPNPATFYCNEMGYQTKVVTGDDGGQNSVCVLPQGKICDIWAFYEGNCGAEYSYCAKQGHSLKIKTDGKDPFSSSYAVCVDRQSGKEIGSVGDLTGLKNRFRKSDKFDGEFFPIKKTHPKGQSFLAGAPLLAGAPPASFDWRSYNGSDWMTSVKDQCSCGACWAFSAVGVSEVAYNIKTNNPNLDINLSEEYLNSDCETVDGGVNAGSCCGGSHDPAFDFIRDYGIPDEACLPFEVSYYSQSYATGNCDCFGNPPCNLLCLGMPTNCSEHLCGARCADYAGRKVKIDDYYVVGANQADIKQNLVDHGPISVCLAMSGVWTGAGNDIYSCSTSTCWDRDGDGVCDTAATAVCAAGKCSGVGRNCSTDADCVEDHGDGVCDQNDCGINHCVIIAGYDDAKGVWHTKNSWGSTWGQTNNGYFDVGYGECHIEAYPRYAVAAELGFPVISIPGNVMFDDTCVGSTSSETLSVCNTGTANLQVSSITSSDPQFAVTTPITGYPVIISPDFCYPFQVLFTPTSTGAKTSTLTILSNDIGHPSVTIQASGNGEQSAIQVSPNPLSFGNVPVNPVGGETDYKDLPLKVRNTGSCDLSVTAIASTGGNAGDFTLLTPNPDFPTTVSPGAEFEFTVRFNPSASGSRTTAIRVTSNSGGVPGTTTDIAANGVGVVPDIKVSGSTDFGDVCAGMPAEKTISICNYGNSNLSVTSVGFNPPCSDFTLINSPFPTSVSPASCMSVVIRFTPTSDGPKSCSLVILSNDPDQPEITLTVTGNTPEPSIDIPADLGFAPTVIQSIGVCQSQKPFPVSNTGKCNLNITNLAITNNEAEYLLLGTPSLPIILEPGHIAGDGDLMAVFGPLTINRDLSGQLTVTYESDAITHDTTTVTRQLCGEGVMTGARVLVTQSGTPIDYVEQIKIQRISGNRNRKIIDTVDVSKNLYLQTVTPDAPCTSFQFHKEYGTVSNQIQLLPGSYQITATAMINGKRKSKTVGFNVDTCGFNQNIKVNF